MDYPSMPANLFAVYLGRIVLLKAPEWELNGTQICVKEEIEHLGAILGKSPRAHVDRRIGQCRKAFFSLQSAGMCEDRVKPSLKGYLWRSALQPVLSYGIDCLSLSARDTHLMDKLQARLVKASLGLNKYMRTTPLLYAMNIKKLAVINDIQTVKLFKSIMFNDSRSKDFYLHIFSTDLNAKTLVSRTLDKCRTHGLGSIIQLLFNDTHYADCIQRLKAMPCNDGLVDSCKMLLCQYSVNDKELLKLLLMPQTFTH
jgi:hypothetical protein